MSCKAKLCVVALSAFLALLVTCEARYTDSAEDVDKHVAEVAEVAPLDASEQQFFSKELDPVAWDAGLPVDVPRALFQDTADDYLPEYAIGPAYKRQIRLDYRKRSRLNRLVQQLLSMRGDRYHYDRVAPMRFGGGRR